MSKERPFEDITPVPNIKVGYFEKEAYLEIIDRQAKQIESFADQIMVLQSRIDTLEKSQRPQGEWMPKHLWDNTHVWVCSKCGNRNTHGITVEKACWKCGVEMKGGEEE